MSFNPIKSMFENIFSNNKDKMMENHRDFSVDSSLSIQDNFQREILRIFFTNLWVNTLGEVRFSTREGEQNLECQAQFIFDRYEVRDDSCLTPT